MNRSVGWFGLALGVAAGAASGDVLYTFHNGYGMTDHVDVSVDVPADLWWANGFQTEPGGGLVTRVRVAFGEGWTLGTPISVLVYDDVDDDGDADNLSLLSRFDTTVTSLHNTSSADSVAVYDVPDTRVSGHFFVGVLALNVPGTVNIRSELTMPRGSSWLALNETGLGTFDPANPAGAQSPPGTIESFIPGQTTPLIDWYVEAEATVAPPCPADFNGSGAVGVGDIFAYLSAWFATDLSADFDGDGGVEVEDVFAFLLAWFGGCV